MSMWPLPYIDQLADIHESWYGYHAIKGHPTFYILISYMAWYLVKHWDNFTFTLP